MWDEHSFRLRSGQALSLSFDLLPYVARAASPA